VVGRSCCRCQIENQEIVEYLRERIASGQFRPVIDRRYPLEQIVEAYRYVETGQKVGNVVITAGGLGFLSSPRASRVASEVGHLLTP